MEKLKKDEPAVWGMLSQGRAFCTEDRHIHWQPLKKEGSEFFIGTLNREEKKGKIIECFRSITGTAYSFTAESLSQDPGKNDASDQGYLESLYKTFGKEPVDIVDPL